ncbi:hypothetical protein CF336_g2545 [Tilletia laevis]|nr:hypothetical protein CF335_g7466 [Tilletia laevis]KAE8196608.1 hypothetical protein CF336_g2545 [Tilletia laevis]
MKSFSALALIGMFIAISAVEANPVTELMNRCTAQSKACTNKNDQDKAAKICACQVWTVASGFSCFQGCRAAFKDPGEVTAPHWNYCKDTCAVAQNGGDLCEPMPKSCPFS